MSPWLGGIDLSKFDGPTLGDQIAQAAHYIEADIISPIATAEASPVSDPTSKDYISFTTPEMVRHAHELGLLVKPYTVRHLDCKTQPLRQVLTHSLG